jgi:transcriptional regulator with XRE-family HTH domain
MRITIEAAAELGLVVRAVRRAAGIRIDDAAATTGVSKQFATDVERGKESVQFGRLLRLLKELGVVLQADIPADAAAKLEELRAKGGVKPPRPRSRPRTEAAKPPAKA